MVIARFPGFATALILSCLAVQARAAPPEEAQASAKPTFKTEILPIFEKHCLRCHGAKVKKGGLDLSTSEAALAGSETGLVVVSKQPSASRLYDMLANGEMPLDSKTRVSPAELETI